MPFQIENGVLLKYTSAYQEKNIVIPDGVTIIGEEAFRYRLNLVEVSIPNGVKEIKNAAFAVCENLTKITIPDSVTKIHDGVFAACAMLKSITIPNSVTWLGGRCFFGCKKLTTIFIPDSVKGVGRNFAENCPNLESISIPKHLGEIAKNRVFYGISEKTKISVRKTQTTTNPTTKAEPAPPPPPAPEPQLQILKEPAPPPPPKPANPEEVCEKTELEMIFEYFQMSQDKDARIYLKNHLTEFMQFLTDKQNVERIHEITEHTDFLTIDNIDEFLRYSIQNSENGGSFKIQLILTDYKGRLLNL